MYYPEFLVQENTHWDFPYLNTAWEGQMAISLDLICGPL